MTSLPRARFRPEGRPRTTGRHRPPLPAPTMAERRTRCQQESPSETRRSLACRPRPPARIPERTPTTAIPARRRRRGRPQEKPHASARPLRRPPREVIDEWQPVATGRGRLPKRGPGTTPDRLGRGRTLFVSCPAAASRRRRRRCLPARTRLRPPRGRVRRIRPSGGCRRRQSRSRRSARRLPFGKRQVRQPSVDCCAPALPHTFGQAARQSAREKAQ